MAEIKIEKLDKANIEKRGVSKWPIWTKEISRFDWHYDNIEECYCVFGGVPKSQ